MKKRKKLKMKNSRGKTRTQLLINDYDRDFVAIDREFLSRRRIGDIGNDFCSDQFVEIFRQAGTFQVVEPERLVEPGEVNRLIIRKR